MPVSSSGLGAAISKASATPVGDTSIPARYFQGRIYTLSGSVFDATTMAPVGTVPASSNSLPLVSSTALIILDTTSQYYCSLQAYDPVTLQPLWEEGTSSGCDVNYYPYSDLFDVGGGRIAFRMTNVYLVDKPKSAPQFSIYPSNGGLQATLELGTNYAPDNSLAVLSRQRGVPAIGILLANQPNSLTLERSGYSSFIVPDSVRLVPTNAAKDGDSYTGHLALLISNTANPPVLVPYRISFVNPYPLHASVSSLSFTWRIGDSVPVAQSFALTKPGKPLAAFVENLPLPSWLSVQNSDNGPPETITVSVKPTGLAAGTYSANIIMGYYCADLPFSVCGNNRQTSPGSVIVPVTLTVIGSGPPSISRVQDAESINTTVVPGEWVAIYGANLAGTSRIWGASDFATSAGLPMGLDGVSVQFGDKAAAMYYVSPAQLDVQVPSGLSGPVPVVVSFRGASTPPFTVNVGTHAPSLFVYKAGNTLYAAATHADGGLIGDPAIQAGSSKAKPGESITLYVNGLGPSQGGVLIGTPVPYTDSVTVTLGGKNCSVSFAGLVSAGLFQLNVQIPQDITTGLYLLTVTASGQLSPGPVNLPIQ
jgi:uncharacterized protein (TIGR03437 family)